VYCPKLPKFVIAKIENRLNLSDVGKDFGVQLLNYQNYPLTKFLKGSENRLITGLISRLRFLSHGSAHPGRHGDQLAFLGLRQRRGLGNILDQKQRTQPFTHMNLLE
jgi:hypothetical protein